MIVTLLPLFLAAQVAYNETSHDYGPEYIYSFDANITAYEEAEKVFMGTNVTSDLICRPRLTKSQGDTRIINCHSNNTMLAHYKENINHERIFQKFDGDYSYSTISFDIAFNDKGVDQIIISEQDYNDEFKNLFYKFISYLFNVGSNLSGRPDGEFKDVDNFGLNECTVNYNIQNTDGNDEEGEITLESPYKPHGKVLYIHKELEVNTCTKFARPFLVAQNARVENSTIELIEAVSDITITDKNFESRDTMKAVVRSETKLFKVTKSSHLKLDNIIIATEKLENINDPIKTSILGNPIETVENE